jgi:helicase-like protein/SNF2 domain-containing protein
MPGATYSCEAEQLLASARAIISRELLDLGQSPVTIGGITLFPHQRRAVARAKLLIRTAGGAMVADATGLGKTFVALAVAAAVERSLIVAPAALLETWRGAATRAGVSPQFVSMERLGRGRWRPNGDPRLVVIDEAHHFRNPCTQRYAALAALCDRRDVLLLSATPLQNRRDDLVTQLALFLGDAAKAASDDDLARLIVRRRALDAGLRLPVVDGPRRVELPRNDDLLDELLSLPPPIPGSDEGEAGALVTYTLLRQWASSRAALVSALRRRLAKAIALMATLETGHWPSRVELSSWSCHNDAVQLALPELFAPLGNTEPAVGPLLDAVRAHADGVRGLLARLRVMEDPDPLRADALAAICDAHPSERVIAFSQYSETVRSIAHLLMSRRRGVAELTARGGRVAGGRITRREILAQFAPATESASLRRSEQITLLITTDVLSEGLDLQRASVIVHLDLPWNPARLEQRVGRVRRLGSHHDVVHVYAMTPPASSERVLRVEARLRAKLSLAARVVGLDAPTFDETTGSESFAPPELTSEIFAVIDGWHDGPVAPWSEATPVIVGAVAPHEGLLVLAMAGEERLLLARFGEGPLTLDLSVVARAIAHCGRAALTPSENDRASALSAVAEWSRRWSARHRIRMMTHAGARLRARAAALITELLASTPRHERAALATLVSRARRVLGLPLGAGAERALARLVTATQIDARWLMEVTQLAEHAVEHRESDAAVAPVVLIVLRAGAPAA